MAPLSDYTNEAGLPSWQHPQPLPRELRPLAEGQSSAVAKPEPDPDQAAPAAAGTVPLDELRRRCLQRGLSAAGDRHQLIERLRVAATTAEGQP